MTPPRMPKDFARFTEKRLKAKFPEILLVYSTETNQGLQYN